ncbi:HPF/RaiA family ribosome-associated protein [Fibrella sp. WM1]|uniref:HPF/RaiA family ribosome-associated protein n=1 Tax=Fibrella musci TaxID=3242485 RepID=UPI00351FF6FB
MRVQTHAVRFTADQTLLDFIQKKLNKLDTFHDRIVSAEVFLKLDGAETTKVKDKIVEVRLNIPGKELFVTERNKSFEAAVDQVVDVMKDKLVRCKQKRTDFSSPAITSARYQLEENAVEQEQDEF